MVELAYTYNADTYCDKCGEAICKTVRTEHPELVPEDYMDHGSYDSDDYPKSYDAKWNESDSPDHCADCRAFLWNPLTEEGYRYVKSMLDKHGEKLPSHASLWAQAYGFSRFDECETCGFECDECECDCPKHVREWRS